MLISIVIPLFNEEEVIAHLRQQLTAALDNISYEIIFVDDGSRDATVERVKEWIAQDERVLLIQLSRNFGHQAAISAGLKESSGDAVVIMDGDLQDPPQLIPKMVQAWQQGYQVVLAGRKSRAENLGRRLAFGAFYKVFEALSDLSLEITGVFGLMDRVVVNHLVAMTERNRFIPGLRSWVGFKTTTIWYDRQQRKAGQVKQSLSKLIKYGMDAIFSFSNKPLRISFILGLVISGLSFIYGSILLVKRILNIDVVHGFTTMAVAIFFLGGVQLMSNGIMGEYLGRIYDEIKARPLFIIARKYSKDPKGLGVKSQEYGS